MGLRLELYADNFVGLVADFSLADNTPEFCTTNNIDEAMTYFDLYLEPKTNRLKKNDPNQRVVDKLAITIDEVDAFQEQLEAITNTLTDEDALSFNLLFEEWSPVGVYNINDRVRHEGVLYKSLLAHEAQQGWSPAVAPSLWAQILIDPEVEGPQEWIQPGPDNAYHQGDRVIHNGIAYESQIDNNIWEPGVVGTESLWLVIEL